MVRSAALVPYVPYVPFATTLQHRQHNMVYTNDYEGFKLAAWESGLLLRLRQAAVNALVA